MFSLQNKLSSKMFCRLNIFCYICSWTFSLKNAAFAKVKNRGECQNLTTISTAALRPT